MISRQKQIIYIVIIAVCVIITVTLWMKPDLLSLGGESEEEIISQPSSSTRSNVFPGSTQFDLSVLESSKFKSLKPYTRIEIQDSELGRENPFKDY